MEATQFTVAMVLKEVLCIWNKREIFRRCNGIIINQETGEKCCNRRQIAIRNASFFTHRNLPSYQELQRATLL